MDPNNPNNKGGDQNPGGGSTPPAFDEETYKAEIHKRNQENASLRKRMKEFEEKSTSSTAFVTKLRETLGVETDEELAEVLGEFAESRKTKQEGQDPNNNPQISKLQKQLDKLTKENEEAKKEAELEREKRKKAQIRTTLQEEFGKANAFADDLVLQGLVGSKVILNDEGKTVWIGDNEEELDLGEGVKAFLESRPYLVKSSQRQGAGSGIQGANMESLLKGVENMSMEDYMKNREQIIKTG